MVRSWFRYALRGKLPPCNPDPKCSRGPPLRGGSGTHFEVRTSEPRTNPPYLRAWKHFSALVRTSRNDLAFLPENSRASACDSGLGFDSALAFETLQNFQDILMLAANLSDDASCRGGAEA